MTERLNLGNIRDTSNAECFLPVLKKVRSRLAALWQQGAFWSADVRVWWRHPWLPGAWVQILHQWELLSWVSHYRAMSVRCLEKHAAPNSTSQAPATSGYVACPWEQCISRWPYCYTVFFNNDGGCCLTVVFKIDFPKWLPKCPVHHEMLLQHGQERANWTQQPWRHCTTIHHSSAYLWGSKQDCGKLCTTGII